MAQSLSKVLLHIVFSTKSREPVLVDKTFRDECFSTMGGIVKTLGCPPIRIGGIPDHVHLLCALSRTQAVADLVKELKRVSSKWIRSKGYAYNGFQWQAGYGVFSIAQSQVPALVRYIDMQEEHHKTASFKEEFTKLLERYGVAYDEAYVWDG